VSDDSVKEPVEGEGYALASIDGIGDGPGFRKVRHALDVKEMGVNAIVLPSGVETGFHFHDEQEELYLLHAGAIEITFGDGTTHLLSPGGMARVDAATHRKIKSVGDGDAVYLVIGAKGGYVGRDGQVPDGEQRIKRS
jgi:mannose-6-phosphate isomerase-like protein (cupin superfamily)